MKSGVAFTAIADAVKKLGAKTPVVSRLRSADWLKMPLALRERSQFSAGVENIRAMATIQDKLLKRVAMQREAVAHGTAGVGRLSFIADLKKVIRQEEIGIGDGGLTDFSSAARLSLIYNFQTESAAEFARWKSAQDSDALSNFPAREFFRLEERRVPRNWGPRWDAAFAPFEGATTSSSGRMVALVNHPGWTNLSRFGTPWPPFDFGSGMGVESVDRSDAVRLGLLEPDAVIESAEADFNANLEASVEGISENFRHKLNEFFGDQVAFKNNKAVWQGNLIGDLVERINDYGLDRPFDNKLFKGQKLSFGLATKQAIAASRDVDLTGKKMMLIPDNVYHVLKQHGIDREKRGDQIPVTKMDIELLPHVWREPDSVRVEREAIQFSKHIIGRDVIVFGEQKGQMVLFPRSMRIKKK